MNYHNNEFLDFRDLKFLVESIENGELGAKLKKQSSKVDILLAILSTLSKIVEYKPIDLALFIEACKQILEFSFEYLSPPTNSLFEERKIRIESLSFTSHTAFSHPDFFLSKIWIILLSINEEVCKIKYLKKPNLDFFDFAIKHMKENTSEYCSLFIQKKISLTKFLQSNNLVISLNSSLDNELYNDFSRKLISQSHLLDSRLEDKNESLKNIKPKEKILAYQKTLIKQLISRVESNDFRLKIINSIKTQRFDKNDLDLDHSIIMGDDGGLFALMNTISEAEKNMLIESDDRINEEFLNCIIQKDTSNKIVIGKGAFGKIRLALVLSINESTWNGDFTMTPGQLICVKKTKAFGERIGDKENSFSDIYDHLLKDYSSMIPVKFIRSPKIYDMTMIQHHERNTDSHIKGYTMQEFLPVLDGKKLFYPGGLYFNQWEHQSRYLIDVFASMQGLIKEGICVTDIKPANTLYDGRTKRAKLIDLASAVRKKNLKKCYFHDICEINNYFAAPEIKNLAEERKKKVTKEEKEELNKKEINLPKAVAYSLGRIIQKIVFEAHQPDCPNIDKLDNLVANLLNENPEERISIKKALVRLNKICEKPQNKVDLRDFLTLLYQKTNDAPFDFGLSESIKVNKKCFINMDVSDEDPEKTSIYKRQSLNVVFEKFCITKEENDHEKVLVLIGCSGSGKTTFLQKKYLDLLKEGKNDVIPLYYNLAKHEKDIKGRWDTLLKLLKGNTEQTEFSFENVTSSYSFVLLIDGVDESLKVNFIMKLFDDVGGNARNRAVVVCRKESLEQDIDDIQSWFKPSHGKNEDLWVKYILPIRNDFDLKSDGFNFFYASGKTLMDSAKFEYSVQNIDEKNIRDLLQTPFLIQMYLNLANLHDHQKLTRFFILEKYLEHQIQKNLNKSSKYLLESLMSLFKVTLEDLRKSILDFANRLALFLYFEKDNLENECKLANAEILLKNYGFVKGEPFRFQLIYNLVKIADLSFKVVKEKSSERISLGFYSESVKNYYITRSLIDDIRYNRQINYLEMKSITNDESLIRMLADEIRFDDDLIEKLKTIIDKSKNSLILNAASNAITLLVAANVSFISKDLSKIKIANANIRDGIFQGCNFSEADLTNVNMNNVKIGNSIFNKTNMKNVKLGIYPDLNIGHPVTTLAISPNLTLFVCASENYLIKLWSIPSQKLLHSFPEPSFQITCLIFSSDNNFFLSASSDHAIKMFDVKLMKHTKTFSGHKNWITSLSIFLDNTKFLSGSSDSTIKLWELSSETFINEYIHEKNAMVLCVACSPSEPSLFLSGSSDKIVRLWEINNSEAVRTFIGHKREVKCVIFSNDTSKIVSGSNDGSIIVWNISNAEFFQQIDGHSEAITYLIPTNFSNKFISAYSDSSIKLWDQNENKICQVFEGHIAKIIWLAYSKNILLSCSIDGVLKKWDIDSTSEKPLKRYEGHKNGVSCVVFTPNGEQFMTSSWDKTIRLWNSKNGALSFVFEGHKARVVSINVSKDGSFLVSGSWDQTIIIWDLNKLKLIKQYPNKSKISSVFFSPDSQKLLVGCWSDSIKIINISEDTIFEKKIHKSRVTTAIYSYDGKNILTGSMDKTICLWKEDANFTSPMKKFKGHQGRIMSLAFQKDDKAFVSGSADKSIILWETNTGNILKKINGHSDFVTKVDFFSDNTKILSSANDKSLILWDLNTCEKVTTFLGHSECVSFFCFSPTTTKFVSSSWDKTIKIWDLPFVNSKTKIGYYEMNISSHETCLYCKDMSLSKPIDLSDQNQNVVLNWLDDKNKFCHIF